MTRVDGRKNDQLRPIRITPNFTKHAEGSVLIEWGDTKVICTASVEESVPPFLKGAGKGWVTAEYSMLPRATNTRSNRDINKLKLNGRSAEIQRLIGRSLRSVTNLEAMGEISVTVDCDVIQADGGTRCASITGGFVALALAFKKLRDRGAIAKIPLFSYVSAVSCGVVAGVPMLDLCYTEDSGAIVDSNFVLSDEGTIIEIQGTGEGRPFTKQEFDTLFALALQGAQEIVQAQRAVIGDFFE